MEILNIEERNELERCEVVIKQGLETFVEVGRAFNSIRLKRLYRIEFSTFEDYCRSKWGMTQQSATRLIRAAETMEILESEPIGSLLPATESQARPLTSLEPEIQRAAWQEVVETHGENITAAKVQEVVDLWKPVNEQVHQAKEEPIFAPTIENIIQEAKTNRAHVVNNSGENEWYTPECYIESARLVMGSINLDPASSEIANQRVKAKTFYTQEDNGLLFDWCGNVWMNPPYAQPLITQFITKLVESNINQAIVLVNNATETAWGQMLLRVSSAVCFHQGRIRFIDPQGNIGQSPLQGQMICYIGIFPKTFANEFLKYGTILQKG
jgi:phage N-6-adenine-methyltransferase